MKKGLAFLFFVFALINLLIFSSGKLWIYKAASITYLKGHVSSYINDFVYFPSNKIIAGEHQEWPISSSYNKTKSPAYINKLHNELETVAFIVIQNDSIKHEQYWHGYSADSMSNSFSIAKSWVSTLIGIAIKDGKIKSLDQQVCDFLPEFCIGKKTNITVKHLLTMSSGLDWKEDYYNPIGKTAYAYYGANLRDLVLSLNAVENPGKIFKYHSSCSQILTFILEKATEKTISEYASEKLWKPLGAKHYALWNTDRKGGDEKGFCCINSNARDLARIGKLYLNYGTWNGQQLLDSSYVEKATSAAFLIDKNGNKNKNYGYHFWVTNHKNMDVYSARGLWGQYVICIPKKKMIIVRLGRKYGTPSRDGHRDDFYAFIDAALEMFP